MVMAEHPDPHPRKEALDDAVVKAKEKARKKGRAHEAKDLDRIGESLQSGEGAKGMLADAVTDVFMGQDASRMVEDPAFEAPSASILDQPIVVIHQDPRLVEVSDEYHYSLPDGTELGVGRQTNQGLGRKLLRMTTNLDSMMKSVVEVTQGGQAVFRMERQGTVGKNTMVISDGTGAVVGEVKQTKRGKRRATFELQAGGQVLASMRTGDGDFVRGYDIVSPAGELLAYVRSVHRGVFQSIGIARFSEADAYVLRLARRLTDPLRTLVIASPMSVDSAVSQDRDGIELGDVARTVRRFLR